MSGKNTPRSGDALLVVDVQNDFLPGGSLGVPEGDAVVPVLNHYIETFAALDLPIVFTRDWHPENHCSFKEQGGPWPVHCVAGSEGAAFAANLMRPADAMVVDKDTLSEVNTYSGFQQTALAEELRKRQVKRVYVGGLATDYCVLNTVKDALLAGFDVFLLTDAIRAVDVQPGDGSRALEQMLELGAEAIDSSEPQKS